MRLDAVVFSNVRWHQPRLFSICFWPPSCSIRCIRMSQLTEKGGTSGKQLFPLAGRRHEEEEEIGPRRDGGRSCSPVRSATRGARRVPLVTHGPSVPINKSFPPPHFSPIRIHPK